MKVRTQVFPDDVQKVREIAESTGFFYDHEVDVAASLVEDTLEKGEIEGYRFLFLEDDNNRTIGFTCFGEIACTKGRYDIYWIVVHNNYRGKGYGKELMRLTENRIVELGGAIAYLETSSTDKYLPTRKFYENLNYFKEAEIKDFYLDNDSKVIYSKRVK